MNKWVLIFLAGFVTPFIIVYMWIRHPILCWREMRKSWRMINYGEHE